ncbi:MAG: AAA family ATPase [Pyrinomonadaceae bacterium]
MKKDLADETNDDNFLKRLGFGDDFDPNEKPRKAREKHQKMPPTFDTMLETRPAGDWLSGKTGKPPGKLFGDLWLEGEIAVLFSATATGKSILATQIAQSIAKGRSGSPPSKGGVDAPSEDGVAAPLGPLECTAKAQKVLYFDFELTEAQFAARYSASDAKVRHRFPRNLIRSEICEFDSVPAMFKSNATAFLHHSVIAAISETDAKIIIIDNITYLTGVGSSPILIMKNLKLLAKNRGLSILVLAHRSRSHNRNAISLNDLQNQAVLANYADSVFTIGRSVHAPNFRYVKHLKSRTSEPAHGASNVIVCRITKISESDDLTVPPSFLGFQHLGFSQESDHFPDYFKKLQAADDRARKLQLQTRRKANSLYEHILSGQYTRYLNP